MNEMNRKKPRHTKKTEHLPLISRIIKGRRIEAELTQKELAEFTGLSHVTIARIEGGHLRVSLGKMQQLLNFLDMELSAIMKDSREIGQKP